MGAINFSIDEKLLALFAAALPLKTFVETGTFKGESLRIAKGIFPECHSVEMSPEYHAAAKKDFTNDPGVHLHIGDSAAALRSLRDKLAGRAVLYWLDAHWCAAENTAGAGSQSPLLGELAAIGNLHSQSVLLIDDARLYLACPPAPHRIADWPDFHSIAQSLLLTSSTHRLMVLNDVIIFYPEALRAQMTQFARDHGVDWLDVSNQAQKYRRNKERIERLKCRINPFRKKR